MILLINGEPLGGAYIWANYLGYLGYYIWAHTLNLSSPRPAPLLFYSV